MDQYTSVLCKVVEESDVRPIITSLNVHAAKTFTVVLIGRSGFLLGFHEDGVIETNPDLSPAEIAQEVKEVLSEMHRKSALWDAHISRTKEAL